MARFSRVLCVYKGEGGREKEREREGGGERGRERVYIMSIHS